MFEEGEANWPQEAPFGTPVFALARRRRRGRATLTHDHHPLRQIRSRPRRAAFGALLAVRGRGICSAPLAAVSLESWPMSRDSVVRVDSIGAEVRIDVHLDVSEARGEPRASPAAPTAASIMGTERTLRAGRIVGGRYELVRLLGRGSMGAVWLANHTTLGEHVALKLMDPTAEAVSSEDASTSAARFRFEAQVAARLSRKTQHVVRVTDHGHDGPVPYLVMELLEGQTLEQALARGPMGIAEVSELVTQIARGLEAAHAEGILHRDLKPANVFLADVGEGRSVSKLLDFGVAWGGGAARFGAPYATARGLIVGTPGYMSPEQAAASELDVRSDVWSLAAIAYEALTGELPIVGRDRDDMLTNLRACRTIPLRYRRPEMPASLDRFFERAFAPRIDARHATCAELAIAFEQAIAGHVPPTARPSRAGRSSAAHARAKRLAPFAALALLAAAGLWASRYMSPALWEPRAAGGAALTHAAAAGAPPIVARPEVPAPTATSGAPPLWTQSAAPTPTAAPRPLGRPAPPGELGEFKSYY
jgi:serine/threonine protein kinase